MNKEMYFSEIKGRYELMCIALKNGNDISASEKGRFEGFMQAGLLLRVTTKNELQQLLESIHFKVFGKSIAERNQGHSNWFSEDEVDYEAYDRPSIERFSDRSLE